MERAPKEIQQIQPEKIRLDQRFNLFKPERTLEDNGFGFRSKINLIGPSTSISSIRISVMADRVYRNEYGDPLNHLEPYNPEQGYQITQEDLKSETAIEKMLSRDRLGLYAQYERIRKKHLIPWLTTLRTDETFNSHLYSSESGNKKQFKPEILNDLKRLRLLLFFPTSHYEGRTSVVSLEDGIIAIDHFLPSDINPLPHMVIISMAVPESKLYQMEGEFILAQKQGEEKGGES